jgi:hypothetical protein
MAGPTELGLKVGRRCPPTEVAAGRQRVEAAAHSCRRKKLVMTPRERGPPLQGKRGEWNAVCKQRLWAGPANACMRAKSKDALPVAALRPSLEPHNTASPKERGAGAIRMTGPLGCNDGMWCRFMPGPAVAGRPCAKMQPAGVHKQAARQSKTHPSDKSAASAAQKVALAKQMPPSMPPVLPHGGGGRGRCNWGCRPVTRAPGAPPRSRCCRHATAPSP